MAVTAYPLTGSLSLSAFRTKVVGASDSVSMSKLVSRAANTSTTTTDIQYYGTNVPWNESGTVGTNVSIPNRTTATPTPTISISDLRGTIPWFWTFRSNKWGYGKYISSSSGGNGKNDPVVTNYGTKLTWDGVEIGTFPDDNFPGTITIGTYTYYKGQITGYNQVTMGATAVHRIGRD